MEDEDLFKIMEKDNPHVMVVVMAMAGEEGFPPVSIVVSLAIIAIFVTSLRGWEVICILCLFPPKVEKMILPYT